MEAAEVAAVVAGVGLVIQFFRIARDVAMKKDLNDKAEQLSQDSAKMARELEARKTAEHNVIGGKIDNLSEHQSQVEKSLEEHKKSVHHSIARLEQTTENILTEAKRTNGRVTVVESLIKRKINTGTIPIVRRKRK